MREKGFSLIELLISITIIGVLATIILSSVSSSRARAYDSKVKQQLVSFRTAAEMYFSNHGNKYGILNSCADGDSGSLFKSVQREDGQPGLYIDAGSLPANSSVVCQSDDVSYAVKVSLYSAADYWCVDSTGASRAVADGSSSTFCP